MHALRKFLKHEGLVFRSKNHGPLAETTILMQGLDPAVKALNLPKAGMHAFRRGCNRRWELARVSGAVIRQHIGHATADMTTLYTGEIPVEQFLKQFQLGKRRVEAVLTLDYVNEASCDVGMRFQGRRSSMRLTGWSAMRASTSRK
jgi:integrase